MTLTEFLLARIAEDETWANEASRHHEEPLPDGGAHWHWADGQTDEHIAPEPLTAEYIGDGCRLSLRSIEEYPYRRLPGTGPTLAIPYAEEVSTAVGAHIVRHDPARVLAECEAKRLIIEEHPQEVRRPIEDIYDDWCGTCQDEAYPCTTLRLLALSYADHPDYREEWRP